jgi:hypothetical protein
LIFNYTQKQINDSLEYGNKHIDYVLNSVKQVKENDIRDYINKLYRNNGYDKPQIHIIYDKITSYNFGNYGQINSDIRPYSDIINPLLEELGDKYSYKLFNNGILYNTVYRKQKNVFLGILNSIPDFRDNFDFYSNGLLGTYPLSLLNYWNKIGLFENQEYKEYSEFLMKGIFGIKYMTNHVVIQTLPRISLDENNRLHSKLHKSVQFIDDSGYYFINGVMFENKELWQNIVDKTINPQEIMNIENQERKAIAIKEIGFDKIIDMLGENAKCIDISKKKTIIDGKLQEVENELWEITGLYRFITIKTVKVICPSTNKTYFLDVPPDMTNANEAIAWTFNMDTKEYISDMTIET